MKTTIDIADSLLTRAKEIAHRDKTTLRALVEQGLDVVMQQRVRPPKSKFKMITFNGGTPTKEFQNAPWDQIRDEIYRGRGT
jgi:hypothetical protein